LALSVVFPLPDKTLLVRPELGHSLLDLIALASCPAYRRRQAWFVDDARHKCFGLNAPGERERFFNQRIKVSFSIAHCNPLETGPRIGSTREI
jgi:hypothetical protein